VDIISKMGSHGLENTHTGFRSLQYLYQEVEQVVTFKQATLSSIKVMLYNYCDPDPSP